MPNRPTPVLQWNRKIMLNLSRQAAQSHRECIDTQKLTTGHGTTLQREIQVHWPEDRQNSPQSGNLHKALIQFHPQGADSTMKRNYDLETFSFFFFFLITLFYFLYKLLPWCWPFAVLCFFSYFLIFKIICFVSLLSSLFLTYYI